MNLPPEVSHALGVLSFADRKGELIIRAYLTELTAEAARANNLAEARKLDAAGIAREVREEMQGKLNSLMEQVASWRSRYYEAAGMKSP